MAWRGRSSRPDPTKCRSGKHEWIPENIVIKRGVANCKACRRECNSKLAKKNRALAKTLTEAQLIDRIDLNAYFWSRIEKREDGCWMWHGCKDGAGYGYATVLQRPVSAHRIAYRLEHGDIPQKHEICHRCDMPLCVNPAHLFAATHLENMRDCRKKGRWPGFPNHYDENGKRKVR